MMEKRTTPRFTIRQFLDLSSDGEAFLAVEILDISLGGLRCVSSTPIQPMTPAYIMLGYIEDHGEKVVEVEGYVVHSAMENGRCMAGIAFTDKSPDAQRAIESYLASHAGKD